MYFFIVILPYVMSTIKMISTHHHIRLCNIETLSILDFGTLTLKSVHVKSQLVLKAMWNGFISNSV